MWRTKKLLRKKHMRVRRKQSIKGGSGRGASGKSSMKTLNTGKTADYLLGLIMYYEKFRNLKPYTRPDDELRQKMVDGGVDINLFTGAFGMLLHSDLANKINKLITDREKRIEGKGINTFNYDSDDYKLMRGLEKMKIQLDLLVKDNPIILKYADHYAGKSKSGASASPVAKSSASDSHLKSPIKRSELYFDLVKLFETNIEDIEKLVNNPSSLPQEERTFSKNQIDAFKPHIKAEIDKRDIETYHFIIKHPNPSYPTQLQMIKELEEGNKRLLDIIIRHSKSNVSISKK